jgi:hypothetical protein
MADLKIKRLLKDLSSIRDEEYVAPRYFLRRNGPSDSEVETVDVTEPLGCHALTRRPGRIVGTTDRLLVLILLRKISLSQEVHTV